MKAATLVRAMPGLSSQRARDLIDECNLAMRLGNIVTVSRAAMFLAQIGVESASLRATEEFGGGVGKEYFPYCGRTFIQLTWSYHYRDFGDWCVGKGLLSDSDYFVHQPERLADDRWAWLGPVWYWTVARPQLNELSDRHAIIEATKAINGGTRGLTDRRSRWKACLKLGEAILPSDGDDLAVRIPASIQTVHAGRCPAVTWRPVDGHTDGPMSKHLGVVLHVNESDGNLHSFIERSEVSCHFELYKDGSGEQYVSADDTSWCQRDGNSTYLSMETEGFTGQLLTDGQLDRAAEIMAWAHLDYDVALELAEKPGDRGLGWHGMGAAHGFDWGHAVCPGIIRKDQRPEILGRARRLLNRPKNFLEEIMALDPKSADYKNFMADVQERAKAGTQDALREWASDTDGRTHRLQTYLFAYLGHPPNSEVLDADANDHGQSPAAAKKAAKAAAKSAKAAAKAAPSAAATTAKKAAAKASG